LPQILDVTLASIGWARVTCKNKNYRASQYIVVTELSVGYVTGSNLLPFGSMHIKSNM